MINNIFFVFCHQDDEMGIFNKIKTSIKQKKNVFIFFLTSGYDKKISKNKISKRDNESINVLQRIGVKKKNIFFIGRKNNIRIYELYNSLKIAYNSLRFIINKLKGNIIIYTHSWEGGNEDHDACHSIVQKLFQKNKKIKKCYQFSLYHGKNTFWNFFKVQDLFLENGKIINDNISLKDKVEFLNYLFYYKTQYKVWIGLYPFILFNLFSNNYGKVQIINKKIKLKKPHSKKLLYERMRKNNYSNIINKINLFLSK